MKQTIDPITIDPSTSVPGHPSNQPARVPGESHLTEPFLFHILHAANRSQAEVDDLRHVAVTIKGQHLRGGLELEGEGGCEVVLEPKPRGFTFTQQKENIIL